MIKEAMGFGATMEEARENAIAKLGASEFDDVQLEVVAMPKKKVLGLFGGSDAQVRAFIEVPEKKNKETKKSQSKPKANKEKAPAKKEQKPVEAQPQKKEKPVEKKVAEQEEAYGTPVDEKDIPTDTPAGKAVAYVKTFLAAAEVGEVDIKVAQKDDAALISLNGDDLNIVIGRRGETLDALQYLASLAANNGKTGRYKISLNVGNYREKREETLISLAKRISAQVLKTGKSRTLEPMNPYERRIIHTAVQSIEGVVSNSFGEGVGRRIVISVEGAEVKPPRMSDNRRRTDRNNRRPKSTTVAPNPTREPKKDSDIPLYGKIN